MRCWRLGSLSLNQSRYRLPFGFFAHSARLGCVGVGIGLFRQGGGRGRGFRVFVR